MRRDTDATSITLTFKEIHMFEKSYYGSRMPVEDAFFYFCFSSTIKQVGKMMHVCSPIEVIDSKLFFFDNEEEQ